MYKEGCANTFFIPAIKTSQKATNILTLEPTPALSWAPQRTTMQCKPAAHWRTNAVWNAWGSQSVYLEGYVNIHSSKLNLPKSNKKHNLGTSPTLICGATD